MTSRKRTKRFDLWDSSLPELLRYDWIFHILLPVWPMLMILFFTLQAKNILKYCDLFSDILVSLVIFLFGILEYKTLQSDFKSTRMHPMQIIRTNISKLDISPSSLTTIILVIQFSCRLTKQSVILDLFYEVNWCLLLTLSGWHLLSRTIFIISLVETYIFTC